MSNNSFLTDSEIQAIGFKSVGKDCLISRNARFYGPQNMTIGNHVRIDDFCILSGKITLGSYIHISAYVALYGAMGIVFEDCSGISARGTIYSAMDDFCGDYMIGPMLPEELTHVTGGPVIVKKYVQIGAHAILFPDLTVGEGSVVGACSLVRKSLEPWGIYAGIPCKFMKARNHKLLELVKDLNNE
jgi:galactoside O-acetyltransferase